MFLGSKRTSHKTFTSYGLFRFSFQAWTWWSKAWTSCSPDFGPWFPPRIFLRLLPTPASDSSCLFPFASWTPPFPRPTLLRTFFADPPTFPSCAKTKTEAFSFRVGSCWVFIANIFVSPHQQTVLQVFFFCCLLENGWGNPAETSCFAKLSAGVVRQIY